MEDSLHWQGFSFPDLVWGIQPPHMPLTGECHVALDYRINSVSLQLEPETATRLPRANEAFW